MMRVIVPFIDLQDNNYAYALGDAYPREGAKPSQKRIKELAGCNNLAGFPLIEAEENDNAAED